MSHIFAPVKTITGVPDTKISPQGSGGNNMKYEIFNIAESGKKVARLEANRDFKDRVVNKHKKSLKKCGMLIPAVVTEATKAIQEGLKVVDFATGEILDAEAAKDYLVLLDANHRYKAHLELLEEDKDYKGVFSAMRPLSEMQVASMLAEINTVTNPWRGGDYGKGAKMANMDKDLPILDFVNEMTSKEFSLDAASKWATLTGKITKSVMADAMNQNIADVLKGGADKVERGRRLLEAARHSLTDRVLKKRYIPDWIISKYEKADDGNKVQTIEGIVNFFKQLGRNDGDMIENAKGRRGEITVEQVIYQRLNEAYDRYLEAA